jgi:hypothetical protein
MCVIGRIPVGNEKKVELLVRQHLTYVASVDSEPDGQEFTSLSIRALQKSNPRSITVYLNQALISAFPMALMDVSWYRISNSDEDSIIAQRNPVKPVADKPSENEHLIARPMVIAEACDPVEEENSDEASDDDTDDDEHELRCKIAYEVGNDTVCESCLTEAESKKLAPLFLQVGDEFTCIRCGDAYEADEIVTAYTETYYNTSDGTVCVDCVDSDTIIENDFVASDTICRCQKCGILSTTCDPVFDSVEMVGVGNEIVCCGCATEKEGRHGSPVADGCLHKCSKCDCVYEAREDHNTPKSAIYRYCMKVEGGGDFFYYCEDCYHEINVEGEDVDAGDSYVCDKCGDNFISS